MHPSLSNSRQTRARAECILHHSLLFFSLPICLSLRSPPAIDSLAIDDSTRACACMCISLPFSFNLSLPFVPTSVSIKGAGENPPRVDACILYIFFYIRVHPAILSIGAAGDGPIDTRSEHCPPRSRDQTCALLRFSPLPPPSADHVGRETWARLILDWLSLITSLTLCHDRALFIAGRVQQPLSPARYIAGFRWGPCVKKKFPSLTISFFFHFQLIRAHTDKSINR